jgi:hypothetical protein
VLDAVADETFSMSQNQIHALPGSSAHCDSAAREPRPPLVPTIVAAIRSWSDVDLMKQRASTPAVQQLGESVPVGKRRRRIPDAAADGL